MDDLNNAINQLQNMLSSPDSKKGIEDMISSLGSATGGGTQSSDFGSGFLNPDNMMKMKSIMDSFQSHDDPRSQLLLALKPYLSASRGARLENAMMLLNLGKLPQIMKTFR